MEEGVLRWAQAREEAKIEQERLKAEKIANAIQELSRPQNSDDSDDSGGEDAAANSASYTQMTSPAPPQPAPRSAFANMSSDILTPVPIAPAKTVDPQPVESNQPVSLDLALFENEDDPFENVERQLINEMEELKSVLNPVKPKPTDSSNNCDTNLTNNLSNSPAFNGPVSGNPGPPVQQQPNSDTVDGVQAASAFMPRNQTYEEGDYVELRMDQQNNSVAFKPADTNMYSGLNGDFSHMQNMNNVNPEASCVYKPVLPPIAPSSISKTPPFSTPGVESFPNNDVSGMIASDYTRFTPDSNLSNGLSNHYSRYNGSSPIMFKQSTETRMRLARSNPDLTQSEPQVNPNVFPLSHSPPLRPSSGQLWNPYKPLPSTPDIMTSSVTSHSDTSSSSDLVSPSEFDPYTRLSNEAQAFVNNFVSMGFSRPQVSRAVHQLGTDEKEVVEYLCNVNKLTDKGFNAVHSEMALKLFDNNLTKAEQYLEMFVQFKELGFVEEKIREALVKENMDRDKALDFLTA